MEREIERYGEKEGEGDEWRGAELPTFQRAGRYNLRATLRQEADLFHIHIHIQPQVHTRCRQLTRERGEGGSGKERE